MSFSKNIIKIKTEWRVTITHENGGADRESSFSRHHESTASYEATLQRSNETPYVTLFTRTEVFQSYADRFSYEDTTRSIREDGSVVVLENRATDEIDALWKFEVVNGTFTDLDKSFTQVRHDHSDRDDGAGEREVSDTDVDVHYDWVANTARNLHHYYRITTFPGDKPDNIYDQWIDHGNEVPHGTHPSELIMPYDGPFDDQTGYPMFLEMAQWFEYENPGLAVDDGNSDVPGLSGPNTPNAPAPEEASKPCTVSEVCFTEGHWVDIKNEPKKTIETVALGDLVGYIHHEDPNAENGTKSKIRYGRVTKVFHNGPAETCSLTCHCPTTGEAKTIRGTANHPFYVVGRGWTALIDLAPGLELLGAEGNRFVVDAIVRHSEPVPVYNLEVEDGHAYFISDTENGEGLLVHNDCEITEPVKVTKIFQIMAHINLEKYKNRFNVEKIQDAMRWPAKSGQWNKL